MQQIFPELRKAILVTTLCLLSWPVTAAATAEFARTEVTFEASDGVRIFADFYDSGNGKTAPLLLLFHQGGGNARGEYEPIVPRLIGQGYHVLTVDQRRGGDGPRGSTRYEGVNRTVAGIGNAEYSYCDTYGDQEAALEYVRSKGYSGAVVAWGSSFSATMVLKLAAEHPDDISGSISFSPAAGPPMEDCQPGVYASRLTTPALAYRARRELEFPGVQESLDTMSQHGVRIGIVENGAHGSSTLVEQRTGHDMPELWAEVLSFLAEVTKQ